MIKFTNKEYDERIVKLPFEVREMIKSFEFIDFIKTVSVDYKLDSFFYSFKQNLYAVIIGLLPPHKFKNELVKDGINLELAEKISRKTHYYIFRKVKEGLREIYTDIKITPKGEIIEKKEKDEYYGLSSLAEEKEIEKRKKEIETYEENDPYIDSDAMI